MYHSWTFHEGVGACVRRESAPEGVKWELGILGRREKMRFDDFHRWRASYLTLPYLALWGIT